MSNRRLSPEEAQVLSPGSDHYTAYVGPPREYDAMGATQFRLLCTLGLRAHHRLLDFGCGSLRAGRLLIPYLDPDHYFGIEPNPWLIEDGIQHEVGADQVEIKRPRFLHHDDFDCSAFGVDFDYVLAQSIFSHCGPDLVSRGLAAFQRSLHPDGLAAVTFIHPEADQAPEPGEGWVYPECVTHSVASIHELVYEAGLHPLAIPWHHPRQTWWLLARSPDRLPGRDQLELLQGAVFASPR
jgi:cyclopropane fatty-acyl-phospholipid synthase-like methyltransferase